MAEAAGKHAGSDSVVTKLSELLSIDVVRRYLEALPPEHAGCLAGLRDPVIGKAISMMHARPARDLSIDELAREAGMSRSVLAERFAKLVGIPPMHYLAKWRMQIASELLTSGKTNLAGKASFSRAFKKLVGVPPSTWRRQERSGE